jgi:hypothetical protein
LKNKASILAAKKQADLDKAKYNKPLPAEEIKEIDEKVKKAKEFKKERQDPGDVGDARTERLAKE